MNGPTLLVIEDEADLRELLEHDLGREGYATAGVGDGLAALELVRQDRPDLVRLDRMIPGIERFEVCCRLEMDTATRDIPVIMLTAYGEEGDIVLGLEPGAEDHVTKLFGWRELLARIRSALRRPRPTPRPIPAVPSRWLACASIPIATKCAWTEQPRPSHGPSSRSSMR